MKAVSYNRNSFMPGTRGDRRFRVSVRSLAAVLIVAVCATTASSSFGSAQGTGQAGESFPRQARRAIAEGRIEEAEALAKARPSTDPDAVAVLGRLLVRRGAYDDARRMLEPAAAQEPGGEAALELGLLLQRIGQTQTAGTLLTTVMREGMGAGDVEAAYRAARAAHALGRPRDAVALYRAASTPVDPAVETSFGTLFLEKYNPAEALRAFKQAIDADPKWAPAHAGLARTLADENPPAAAESARRALDIDPGLADAHLLLANLELDNTRYEDAREHIDKVLEANPSHIEARSLVAAIAYVRDNRQAFDAEVKQVLAINPGYGEVYRVAGDLAARNYRFDEAVALTRQAIALDPSNTRAHGDLGMHLMRTGEEPEARRALERSFKDDPYDRVTYNLLTLLDKLEKFEVIREGDIILKLDPEEAPVIREYALPIAQDALKTLSARYQFTPKGPILVEIFPNHDDFAVRNLGLPGLIGALGACFGRVISMDSPRARNTPGSFSWQATLWHEMAHVITLQMSNQRVPRWLTEGISVYEETQAKPAWGRDMELPFAMALERGQVLKLKDLNSGFTRPETIALAYYQASLLVDHIVRTHGDKALHTLVRSFGDGTEGDAAISKALGVSIDQLQAAFDKSLDTRFAGVRAALRERAKTDGASGSDLATLRIAATTHPNSYQAQLAFGAALAAQGDKAAFEPLEKAAALVPMATGEDSPHALMGALAEKLGDTARAIKEYQALLVQDHTAIEPARRLAALAAKAQDEKALAAAHDRIVEIDPFDAQGHTGLGRLALKSGNAVLAMREFKAALAVGPADLASAHCDLGESYLAAGRLADAKREVLAALEIAPSFERAQDLLLKIVDGRGGSGGSRR
jgi:tetratricopeptide (TPR) repeat protein